MGKLRISLINGLGPLYHVNNKSIYYGVLIRWIVPLVLLALAGWLVSYSTLGGIYCGWLGGSGGRAVCVERVVVASTRRTSNSLKASAPAIV